MTSPATPGPRRLPFHPPLVHVPIGGVITAAVLDVVSALTGSGHGSARDLYRAATWVLMIGMGVMFVAALAGLADRPGVLARQPAARGRVNRHAGVMGAVMAVTIADLTLRRQHYGAAGATPAAVLVIEAVAVALLVYGGHQGGKLTHGTHQDADVASGGEPAAAVEEQPAR